MREDLWDSGGNDDTGFWYRLSSWWYGMYVLSYLGNWFTPNSMYKDVQQQITYSWIMAIHIWHASIMAENGTQVVDQGSWRRGIVLNIMCSGKWNFDLLTKKTLTGDRFFAFFDHSRLVRWGERNPGSASCKGSNSCWISPATPLFLFSYIGCPHEGAWFSLVHKVHWQVGPWLIRFWWSICRSRLCRCIRHHGKWQKARISLWWMVPTFWSSWTWWWLATRDLLSIPVLSRLPPRTIPEKGFSS